MVLFVECAVLRMVFLNAFVMALVSFPVYVNFAHCVLFLSCFGFSLLDVFSKIVVLYPFFLGSAVYCTFLFAIFQVIIGRCSFYCTRNLLPPSYVP